MGDPRHDLGRRAEAATAAWLEARGWTVLDRRWRCPYGELDLVCLDPGRVLVGVEVKLRRSAATGTGADALDRRRLARLRAALGRYAAERAVPAAAIRLDLAELQPAEKAGLWRLSLRRAIDGW